jgi:signal transduction histidine kinase
VIETNSRIRIGTNIAEGLERPWLMPGISGKQFQSTIQAPAADALDAMQEHAAEALERWANAIRSLELTPSDFVSAADIDFAKLADRLRQATFADFRKAVEQAAERLGRKEVGIDRALAALNRLFEIGLPYIGRARENRATLLLAWARLHTIVELVLLGGYAGRSKGRTTLLEASFSEAETRIRGTSAYVTKIYERERRRLSHDLHDEIGHDLIMIKLYLEMIQLDLRRSHPREIERRLNDAIGLVSHSLDAVRRLVLDLGPAVFDELGFLPAVKSYAAQFSSRTKVNVTVQEGYLPEHVPLTHQIAMYRLLQGALSNVLKHAHAKNVKISLGSMKDSVLIMVIEDDGIGFDTAVRPGRRSFGLTAMRERVAVLGGRIRIQSRRADTPGTKHGTRIEVDLPLSGREEKSA